MPDSRSHTHATHPAPSESGTSARRYSLRRSLVVLVVWCVLPAMVVSTVLVFSIFRQKQVNVEWQAALVASAIKADAERELAAIESALKVLATSSELAAEDWRGFHGRAKAALPQGLVHNYILTDAQGHQVLNTAVPWGKPLPTTGTPAQLSEVFERGTTVVTDLFKGPVTGMHVLAMGVPVVVDGRVRYSLNVGLTPQRLSEIVSRQPLQPGWLVAMLDGRGVIIARSRDAERYVAQSAVPELVEAVQARSDGFLQTLTKEGVPVFSAYTSTRYGGWRVVVGAPTAQVGQDMFLPLWWAGGGVAVAFLAGLWLARRMVLRVLRSVQGLNDAALALGKGEPVKLPATQWQEADAVGQAMVQASEAVQRIRFLAQHDALTELPNRVLLGEVAQRALALAQRMGQQVAVLALDLDGFKAVNDTHGHAAGDRVLRVTAQRIQAAIRASDMAARVGGDEFLIMLVDVSAESAMDTAQRLVELLSARYDGVAVPVSASVGVALYPGSGADLQALVIQADRALYQAKHGGKARAAMASHLPTQTG